MAVEEIQVGARYVYAVDFEAPESDADGYVRRFRTEVRDLHHDIVGNRDMGRLRFIFRGDRGDREFMVLRESYDQESGTWDIPDRVLSTDDATGAVEFMKHDAEAGRLAVSVFFAADDPEYGFPAIH